MTPEQAIQLIGSVSTLIDAVMLCSGMVGGLIVASTWKG